MRRRVHSAIVLLIRPSALGKSSHLRRAISHAQNVSESAVIQLANQCRKQEDGEPPLLLLRSPMRDRSLMHSANYGSTQSISIQRLEVRNIIHQERPLFSGESRTIKERTACRGLSSAGQTRAAGPPLPRPGSYRRSNTGKTFWR
ncbi:hypothetical protein F5883DRAFT_107859 [Diaporthe sp. PMI_573]|nr:hypothetical protein F5883DRAFT_107859 [Diaporthaceae sp. PMI_573]